MLSAPGLVIWRRFMEQVRGRQAQLEREDMVPLAIIFGRVKASHDDHVGVDTTDVIISTPGGAHDAQLRQALYSALTILEEKGP